VSRLARIPPSARTLRRTIGIARATLKIGMANLVYNLKRLIVPQRPRHAAASPGNPIRGTNPKPMGVSKAPNNSPSGIQT
jgi:hypothetical protein